MSGPRTADRKITDIRLVLKRSLGDGPTMVLESTVSNPELTGFMVLTDFWGEDSASSSRPTIWTVCQSELAEFVARLSEFSRPKLYSGNSIRSLKDCQYSAEGQKFHQNLAPVLVRILWNSLVFSRKIITSTDFYRYCAPARQHQQW